MFDLDPAAAEMARLVSGVADDHLDRPTPCSDWTVGDLLAHIHQFAAVFAANARKEEIRPPDALEEGWRTAIPDQLTDLVVAWRTEAAWHGRVSAGGVDMNAADNAVVAIEELTVHGWDLAAATGQPFHPAEPSLDQIDRFFDLFGGAPFAPPLPAPAGAARFEQILARTGRDPAWRADE